MSENLRAGQDVPANRQRGADAAVRSGDGWLDGEELRQRATEIIARYPEGRERSALLPLLHLVQAEVGYVSPAGIGFCAEVLGLTKAQVAAVATFYTMYKRRPAGDWLVSVCTNTMCGVLGGDAAFAALTEELGVGHDQTTPDGVFTLEHAECLAACDYAPVMTVNYEYFDGVQADRAREIVGALRRGERPQPDRGARLCTMKEMSIQLAGFADEREDALADGPPGEPSLAGARLAAEHGITVAGFDPDTPIGTKEEAPAQPGHAVPETVAEPSADRSPAGEPPPAAGGEADDAKAAAGDRPAPDGQGSEQHRQGSDQDRKGQS